MVSKKIFVLLVGIILAGALLRIAAIDQRPIHHDEVSAQIIGNNIIQYKSYKYDPEYHSPLTFYIVALGISIFGNSEIRLRIIHLLFSVITLVLIPLIFRKNEEKVFMAALLLLSPIVMYYSSYAYFESWWILIYLMWIMAILRLLEPEKHAIMWLYVLLALPALMLGTHEFSYVIFAIAGIFLIIMVTVKKSSWHNLKEKAGKLIFLHIILGIILFCIISAAIWSAGFTNVQDLPTNLEKSVTYNIKKASTVSGHTKPFPYYFKLLGSLESVLCIIFVVGLFLPKTRKDYLLIFLFVFPLIILSINKYKTPWTIVLVLPPLLIFCALTLSKLYERLPKKYFGVGVAILACISFYVLINSSFVYATDDTHNLLAYVQTTKETWVFEDIVNRTAPQNILIVGSERQILGYLLRSKKTVFQDKRNTTEADFQEYSMIIEDDSGSLSSFGRGFSTYQFRLRPGVQQTVYYKED
jgi:uncharacterized protein (TIGR03663 family)